MSQRYSKRGATPNLQLWDEFFMTPTAYTKQFSRKGGFKGTALQTMYVIERLTEKFGAFGMGWGIEQKDCRIIPVPETGETLVYLLVGIWYKQGDVVNVAGYQWGGDYIATKGKDGVRADDEAFKKAATDGMLKCAAWLGIGADIHYGLYDDSKYLAVVEKETERKKNESKPQPVDAAPEPGPAPAAPAKQDPPKRTFKAMRHAIFERLIQLGDTEEDADNKAQSFMDAGAARLDAEGVTDGDERKVKGLDLLQIVINGLDDALNAKASGGQG